MTRKYKNLFFDLDDTLWAFSVNARDTFEEMYHKYNYERYFNSFSHFYELYERRNAELWGEYEQGEVTKEELNKQRFFYPLKMVGVNDEKLAKIFADNFFAVIPTKEKLVPHAREVLKELSSRYNLYILSARRGPNSHSLNFIYTRSVPWYFNKVCRNCSLVLPVRPLIVRKEF